MTNLKAYAVKGLFEPEGDDFEITYGVYPTYDEALRVYDRISEVNEYEADLYFIEELDDE